MSETERVLILGTGNSAPSQMAEGWLHAQGAARAGAWPSAVWVYVKAISS